MTFLKLVGHLIVSYQSEQIRILLTVRINLLKSYYLKKHVYNKEYITNHKIRYAIFNFLSIILIVSNSNIKNNQCILKKNLFF